MRRRYRGLIVTAGVVATVAAGGGLTAWAGWSAGGSSAVTTARSGRVPTMEPPRAEISGKSPKIEWDAVPPSAGVPIDRYVVIRIQGPAREEVCRTSGKSCRDADAPAGGTLTYVVHATQGAHWVGEDSKPSNAVVVPGPSARTNEVSAVNQSAPGPKITSTPAGTANRDAKPADDVPGAPNPKPTGEPAPTVTPEPSTSPSAAPDGTGSAPPLGTD